MTVHTGLYWYVLVYTGMYLTIGTQNVPILRTKPVNHVHNMCNTAMMKSQSSIFAPVVGLIKSCALFQAGHHAQHPPCTGFARHRRVQIANGNINGPDWYFVLYETAVNVHNNCQWNRPLPNPDEEVLEHNSTSMY